MPVTLSDEEALALREALDNYLPELRYELARIKLERERHGLVALEQTLSALLRRLQGELPPDQAPQPTDMNLFP